MNRIMIRLGIFSLAFSLGSLFVPDTLNLPLYGTIDESILRSVPDDQDLQTVYPIGCYKGIDEQDPETVGESDWLADKTPLRMKLLEIGDFHGDEVNAKNGEKWLGLFEAHGSYSLKPVTVRIKREHDPIVDETEKIKTGKNVSVTGTIQPIFLVKNGDRLNSGPVTSLFRGKTWEDVERSNSEQLPSNIMTLMREGFQRDFEMNGTSYSLKVVNAQRKDKSDVIALFLEGDGKRQFLNSVPSASLEPTGTLYWIGDLDGDKRPDFYFDLFVHYNVANRVLYLSSGAEKGKLVKLTAQFWTTGC